MQDSRWLANWREIENIVRNFNPNNSDVLGL